MKLANKVAIVTGGGQGIGKAVCLAFAQEGADVVVADLRGRPAEDVSKEVSAFDRKSLSLEVDVADGKKVKKMVEATVATFGRVDVLVNGAGMFIKSSVEDITEEDWDRVMAVNLKGTLLCSQAAGKEMIKQGRGGAIVNIASTAAHIPQPYSGAYSPSKAGVLFLTQMIALEWAKHHIRVNAVSPGSVMTPLFQSIYNTEESLARRAKSIPMNRISQPEEIAKAVVYLSSDDSSYVTGHALVIDGGSSIGNFYLLGLLP